MLGRSSDAYVLRVRDRARSTSSAPTFLREIEPGEMVVDQRQGPRSLRPFAAGRAAAVHLRARLLLAPRFGARRLVGLPGAEEHRRASSPSKAPVDADVVIPVPDSGSPGAIGYARQAGLPFELGIIRSHYVGRTFIEPRDQIRHLGVKLKLNANRAVIEGKRVVLVDDSIVRGTTSLKIVQMVREAGARRGPHAHRLAADHTACFYGVDTPERASCSPRR